MIDGRIRSLGHEEAGVPLAESLLERWGVHTLHGYDVRGQVLGLVGNHLKPGQLYDDRERVSDGAIRRLAGKCEPDLLYRVARADCLGRTGDFPAGGHGVVPDAGARARGRGAPAGARS